MRAPHVGAAHCACERCCSQLGGTVRLIAYYAVRSLVWCGWATLGCTLLRLRIAVLCFLTAAQRLI